MVNANCLYSGLRCMAKVDFHPVCTVVVKLITGGTFFQLIAEFLPDLVRDILIRC